MLPAIRGVARVRLGVLLCRSDTDPEMKTHQNTSCVGKWPVIDVSPSSVPNASPCGRTFTRCYALFSRPREQGPESVSLQSREHLGARVVLFPLRNGVANSQHAERH